MLKSTFLFIVACSIFGSGPKLALGGGSLVERIRTVAVTGGVAGSSLGVFGKLNTAVMNNAGDVAFTSSITGIPGVSDTVEGLFVERGGNLDFITRTGSTVQQSTAAIRSLFRPRIADSGEILVSGTFEDPDEVIQMLLSDTGGGLRIVASGGSAVTGLSNGNLFGNNFREPRFATSGVAAFAVDLLDGLNPIENPRGGPPIFPSLGMSIWKDSDGVLELVSHVGDPAPSTDSSTIFGRPAQDTVVVNGSGQVAYSTSLNGPNITIDNFNAIYVSDGETDRLVARRGDIAPGFGPNEVLLLINEIVTINGLGEVAFATIVQLESGAEASAIYAEKNEQLRLVASSGGELPGLPDGVFFGSNLTVPVINDRSEVAFMAKLTGSGINPGNGFGLWSEGLGGMHMVARQFEQAAGTEPGVLYDGFRTPFLNSNGQTAFRGVLSGVGVDSSNDRALWAEGPSGDLRIVVREGDIIEVTPGDTRTVDFVLLPNNIFFGSGNNDGLRSPFNNRGEIVFQAFFDDGTRGIFVSSVASIPEPSTLRLMSILLLYIVRQEHRVTKSRSLLANIV